MVPMELASRDGGLRHAAAGGGLRGVLIKGTQPARYGRQRGLADEAGGRAPRLAVLRPALV